MILLSACIRYPERNVLATRPCVLASLIALALGLSAQARAQAPAAPARERVTFRSGTLTLVGFLFKPEGTGPFPGLIWNHGSEKNPGAMRQFAAVAAILVPAGYVVFAPMRRGNAPLQERLISAARKIEIPVFLIQPPKDASLEPSHVLGREFQRLGKTYTGKIYPPEMPEDQQGHCFGGANGMHVWAQDVLAFFAGALR